jgi:hypothetical protein
MRARAHAAPHAAALPAPASPAHDTPALAGAGRARRVHVALRTVSACGVAPARLKWSSVARHARVAPAPWPSAPQLRVRVAALSTGAQGAVGSSRLRARQHGVLSLRGGLTTRWRVRHTDESVPGKRAEELAKNFDHLATEERLYQWRVRLARAERTAHAAVTRTFWAGR